MCYPRPKRYEVDTAQFDDWRFEAVISASKYESNQKREVANITNILFSLAYFLIKILKSAEYVK